MLSVHPALSRWLGLRVATCETIASMMTKISYNGYRFPPVNIQQAIWLYARFTLSFRDVEDLLAERGVMVSYKTVRRWVNHFGSAIAADLRKGRPRPHFTWHLDEVYIKIDGRLVYLWRAVDAEGEVLGGTREEGCRRDTACGTSDKILVVLVASPCATGCSGRPGCSGGTAHSGRPSGSRVTRGTHCAGRTRSADRASCSGRAGGPVEPVAPVLPVAPVEPVAPAFCWIFCDELVSLGAVR
jgi:hypothetical protein